MNPKSPQPGRSQAPSFSRCVGEPSLADALRGAAEQLPPHSKAQALPVTRPAASLSSGGKTRFDDVPPVERVGGRTKPERRRVALTTAVSVGVHLALGAGSIAVFTHGFSDRSPPGVASRADSENIVEIELPTVSEGVAQGAPVVRPIPQKPVVGGIDGTPRPDTAHPGRGGTDSVREPALNLADRDDTLTHTKGMLTRLDRAQLSRIDAGTQRRAREDWRASREPMMLTFLVTGRDGRVAERRPNADFDPAAGQWGGTHHQVAGGARGAEAVDPGMGLRRRNLGGASLGGTTSVGPGIRDGAATNVASDAAKRMHARPLVDEGTPSVPSNTQGKPSDTLDSADEVSDSIRAIIHASTAGGSAGKGPGGQQAAGATGSGGERGAGSKATALGNGQGGRADPGAPDARRTQYLTNMWGRIWPHWADAMPKWAALDGHGATAIVQFTLDADGTVRSAVITRPSGISEFDENVRRAVLRAGPYGSLPPGFGSVLTHSFPFIMDNPAVRPKSARR